MPSRSPSAGRSCGATPWAAPRATRGSTSCSQLDLSPRRRALGADPARRRRPGARRPSPDVRRGRRGASARRPRRRRRPARASPPTTAPWPISPTRTQRQDAPRAGARARPPVGRRPPRHADRGLPRRRRPGRRPRRPRLGPRSTGLDRDGVGGRLRPLHPPLGGLDAAAWPSATPRRPGAGWACSRTTSTAPASSRPGSRRSRRRCATSVDGARLSARRWPAPWPSPSREGYERRRRLRARPGVRRDVRRPVRGRRRAGRHGDARALQRHRPLRALPRRARPLPARPARRRDPGRGHRPRAGSAPPADALAAHGVHARG